MTETFPTPPTTALADGPYKGLRPYEEQDQHHFFGRDADCNILLDKILTNKLTLLFAATGVGKSSLLQAAILPRLKDPTREHLDVVYFKDWVGHPLTALKRTVLDALQERHRLDATAPLADLDSFTLQDFLQFCSLFTRPPLVVILDQFEEFFQYQRTRDTFQPFLRQLADVITDRATPVAVVIAMREDFALELNALKPYLPTLLFDNFYRLEKLDRKSATDAIVRPVELAGFRYEEALLEALLNDLVIREQASHVITPVADFIDTVEPPYLQITCSELWKLEQHNPEKTLRLKTYQDKRGAQGLLKTYVENVLGNFSATEKNLASVAFNHLITRRGTKMAYTAIDLASLLREDPQALDEVLERLSTARILRSQSRQQVLWYELYHDLFSDIIETWNDAYKSKQRNKRALLWAVLLLGAVLGMYVAYDATMNVLSYHMRLSVRDVSDALELYRGQAGSRDIFGLQQYMAETGYRRAQVEPDKLFVQKPVNMFDRLNLELIGLLPLEERIVAYWKSGQLAEMLALTRRSISDDNLQRSQAVIDRLADFKSIPVFKLLEERLKHLQTAYLRAKIATVIGTLRVPQSVVLLMAALNDNDPNVRRSAAQALGQLGSVQALPALLERLTDQDASMRQIVVQALGQLGSVQALPVLLERLTDQNPSVRQSAVEALGQLGSVQALPALLERLTDQNPSVRQSAVEVLGQLGSVQALPALLERLTDQDTDMRRSAVRVLGQLGSVQALPALLERLTDQNPSVRQSAVEALGRLESVQVLPALLERLTDQNPDVRWSAVRVLGQLGSVQALPALLERLTDQNPDVRRSAVRVLGQLGSVQALPALLERLTDQDTDVRWSAVEAIRQLGSVQALPALLERLTDQDTDMRRSAVRVLGQLGSVQVLPALLERIRDKDHNVRRAALHALGSIDAPKAQDAATAVFQDPTEQRAVQAVAAAILLAFDHQESLALLQGLASSEGIADRIFAAEGLGSCSTTSGTEILLQLLQEDNMQVKTRAITSLGQLKATTAIPALTPLLTEAIAGTDVSVQMAVVTALSQMATDDSRQVLRVAVENPGLAMSTRRAALAALSHTKADTAVESILKAAGQDAPEETPLRLSAYKLLGALQIRQALPLLRQHLTQLKAQDDKWRKIRDEAREDFTDKETEAWKKRINTAQPASYWFFDLAYTMARIDPEETGLALLTHDIANVRNGAATGLGEVGTVQLVQRLHNLRLHSTAPLVLHALYRAINHILIRLEATGSQDDVAALRKLLPQVQAREEVSTRVEWTILQLERLYSDVSPRNAYHQN